MTATNNPQEERGSSSAAATGRAETIWLGIASMCTNETIKFSFTHISAAR